MSHSSGASTYSLTSRCSQDSFIGNNDPAGILKEEGEIEDDVTSPNYVHSVDIDLRDHSTGNHLLNGHMRSKLEAASVGSIPDHSKWIYTNEQLNNTPSVVRGMIVDDERMLRRIGIQLISRIHSELNEDYKFYFKDISCPPPPARVVASASVFFHRFYMCHPLQIFHPVEVAVTCYYLACKTEEKPRPGTDIIIATRQILHIFYTKTGSIFDTDCAVGDIKKDICTLENILLQTINFEVIVEHPFTRHIEKCLRCFKYSSSEAIAKLRKRINYFLQESLTSSICLQWSARPVAISFVLLACNKEKISLKEWDTLHCESEFFEFEKFCLLKETVKKVADALYASVIETNGQIADPRISATILERTFFSVVPKTSENECQTDAEDSFF